MSKLRILTVTALVTALAVPLVASGRSRPSAWPARSSASTATPSSRKAATVPPSRSTCRQVVVTAVLKATVADIKPGAYIGSGAVPQADGSQKAVEVHIFAESMRGQGDGHRPGWYGAPNGTMTNGARRAGGTVGSAAAAGGEPSFIVKYKEGEKRIVVPANAHIVRYEVGSKSDIKAGAPFTIQAADKQPDGTSRRGRINVGRDGGRPF